MKHLYRGLAASAAALLLSAGLASPAFAQIADTGELTVTPTSGAPGDEITVTGTGCDSADDQATVGLYSDDGTAGTPDATEDEVTVAVTADDTFEATLTVPADADPALDYYVLAECGDEAYDAVDYNVTLIGDGGDLDITPTSGRAGTVITVSGTECGAETVDVIFGSAQDGEAASREDVPVADDGSWSTTITVPGDARAEQDYAVNADCGGDFYGAVLFDVLGPTGGNGYREVAADGGIFTFGDRRFWGSTGDIKLNRPIVGGATDKSDYEGYWMVASDGGVFAFNADFYGSLAGRTLPAPAVEIEPTPTGKGYWIVLANGKVHEFGDAKFFGDISGTALNQPVIGMSVTPSGQGYWLVGQDGGIFDYGDAEFFGSMGDKKLNAPVIDLAPAVDNNGYYLLGADGGVFTFGSADFKGSTGAMKLNAPVVAMLVAPTGAGYWLAASDGGIFTFGAVDFLGSMGGTKLNSPVLDLIN